MSKPLEQADLLDPHDTLFRQLLSEPKSAADFIENYLPAPVVALLDLPNLRIEKDTFVDARLRKHYSDVLYSVPLKQSPLSTVATPVGPDIATEQPKTQRGKRRKQSAARGDGRIYLYLLFEHKSQPDMGMRLQLLRYMTRIWEKEWKRRSALSAILPIVFYHGQEKWHYSPVFADLINAPAALQPYTLTFQHLLIDLSAYSDDELRGEVWLRANLLLLKHIADPDLVHKLPTIFGLLVEMAQQTSGLEMFYSLLIYISAAGKHVSEAELFRAVKSVFPERSETMAKTLAQKWIDQGIEKGIEKGIEQGIEKGIEQGKLTAQRQTLARLLPHRFQLSAEQQASYVHDFDQIQHSDHLAQLVDQLLSVTTIAAFEEAVRSYLPVVEQTAK